MNQLAFSTTNTINLPIFQDSIDGETIQTVNARDLHRELEVGRDFSTWMKERISRYGFIDGSDFCSFLSESSVGFCSPNMGSKERGGHNKIEYHISFDMAKELAMVEANKKGQEIRRYFIQKEKEARQSFPLTNQSIAAVLQDCLNIAQIFGLTGNQALLSASLGAERRTGFNPANLIGIELASQKKEKIYTPTELGKAFLEGISGRKVNSLLEKAGFQERIQHQWELTELGKNHAEIYDTGRIHNSGSPVKQIKWFKSVVSVLTQ